VFRRKLWNAGVLVMAKVTLDAEAWAEQQFGECDLKDHRRTKRLKRFAIQMVQKPDASTPRQTETWGELKAAYRLFNRSEVTFGAITAPHQALTRAQMTEGTWLILNDTTELNFGYLRDIKGIGRVGSTGNRGFFLHTALAVNAQNGTLAGVAAHELYTRPLKKVKRVSSSARKRIARRETDVWRRVVDEVGAPPTGAHFIHVCDRGADNYDLFCQLKVSQAGWVIRAAQLKRQVLDEHEESLSLDALLNRQSCLGTYQLTVKANGKQSARTAQMQVRAACLTMPRPKTGVSRFAKQTGITEIPMWVVEVREISAVPRGTKPLRWVLLTSEQATTFTECWQIVSHYEQRPLIEEYHKCLKTGCDVESRQYQTADRLGPVIGVTTVTAVRLLQLKLIARDEPDRPVHEVAPARWIEGLRKRIRCPWPVNTVREFFRGLASLGGFLGRKGDGEPGWQTIWRGLETLVPFLQGMDAEYSKCG
jgi:transposase-like protein/transposase Tn5 family protein